MNFSQPPILRVGKGPLAGACWSTCPVQVVLSGPAVDTGLPFSGEPVPLIVTVIQGLQGLQGHPDHLARSAAQPRSTDRVQVGPDGTVRLLQPAARPCVLVLGRAVAFKYRRLDLAVVPISEGVFCDVWWNGRYKWGSPAGIDRVGLSLLRLPELELVWQGRLWEGPYPDDVSEVLYAVGAVLVRAKWYDGERIWLVYDLPSCDLLVSIGDYPPWRLRLAPTGEALYGFAGGDKGDPAQMSVWYRREGFQVRHALDSCPVGPTAGELHCVSPAHELLFADGTVWREGDPLRSLGCRCPLYPEWNGRRIVSFDPMVCIQ